jgi:hypothetical protein
MDKLSKPGWRRIAFRTRTKAGDRAVYSCGVISKTSLPKHEVGMMMAETGYLGVARKLKRRKP